MTRNRNFISRAINAIIAGRERSAARDIAFYQRRYHTDDLR